MSLDLCPITLREAHTFVSRHHRHHATSRGGVFAVAVAEGDDIVGVAIIGRPVARLLQDGYTAEVTRVATLGNPNACSKLYAAAWRACRAMGYRRLLTYTLAREPGTSLRAAGWRAVAQVKGQSWNRPGRPRVDEHLGDKIRWEAAA